MKLTVQMTEKAYRYCQSLANANKDIRQYIKSGLEHHVEGFVFQNVVLYTNNLIWTYAGIEKEDLLLNALAVYSNKYLFGDICYLDTFSHTIIDDGGSLRVLDWAIPIPADVKPSNSLMRIILNDEASLRATIHFESLSHESVN